MPFFFLLFGQMVNGFGENQTDLNTMTHEVSKIGCWMYTGERQVCELRKRYLEAV
ncbi:putative ABC transporter type 1, transmembrane domain superfamily [Helianthus anomalus]